MLEEIKILYVITLKYKYVIEDWTDTSTCIVQLRGIKFSSNQIRKFLNNNEIEY